MPFISAFKKWRTSRFVMRSFIYIFENYINLEGKLNSLGEVVLFICLRFFLEHLDVCGSFGE